MSQPFTIVDGPKSVKVTPALAKQIADMPQINHDRPFSEIRYDRHRKSLEQHRFRPPEWGIAYCKENDVEYRVNGNHTSRMLAEAPPALLKDVRAIITRYECPTLEDVAILWSTFDPKVSTRGARDIYAAFAGSNEQLTKINHNLICIIAAGLGYSQEMNKRVSGARMDPMAKGELLVDEKDFVKWAASIINGDEGTHLRRAPVTAAMYDTWKKSQADAKRFWSLVRTGEGTKPKDSDRLLQKFLLQVSIRIDVGPRDAGHGKRASQREVYARCITAWNAMRKGISTDMKYFAKAKLPAVA